MSLKYTYILKFLSEKHNLLETLDNTVWITFVENKRVEKSRLHNEQSIFKSKSRQRCLKEKNNSS